MLEFFYSVNDDIMTEKFYIFFGLLFTGVLDINGAIEWRE